MTDAYEEQKASSGSLATWVFIFSALYLFVSNGGFSSLLSLKAAVFFVVGMFVAAIAIGIPAYLLQRGAAKVLMKSIANPFSQDAVSKIKAIGVVLMLLQIVVTFFVTKLAYEWLIV